MEAYIQSSEDQLIDGLSFKSEIQPVILQTVNHAHFKRQDQIFIQDQDQVQRLLNFS